MPLVTLTVRKPKSKAFKSAVLDAVHESLVATGVPVADKFQRVLELDADDFRYLPDNADLFAVIRVDELLASPGATRR